MNGKGNILTMDTNVPINYVGHVTNFVRDKENVAVVYPEILFEELDNVKEKYRGTKLGAHGVYEASSFFSMLTDKFETEMMPINEFGMRFSDLNSGHRAKVIDFSNPRNQAISNELGKDNILFKDKLEGKLALISLKNLIKGVEGNYKELKANFEEYVMKDLDFFIDLGINDNLLAGLTIKANKESDKKVKIISLDYNLKTKINLEKPGLVEAPTGGLRLAGENYQGYRILSWDDDFVANSYRKEFLAEIMRMNDKGNGAGLEVDLSKFNKDLLEKFHTQDYLVFVDEDKKRELFKRMESGEDIPQYNMPKLNKIVRLVQTGRDKDSHEGKYKLFPLDQKIVNPNHRPKYLSNFQTKSLEGLLFLDSMLQDKSIYILHGEAGTGKTYSAMYLALAETLDRVSKGVKDPAPRLIINKPLVNLGSQNYGFLPGDLYDKHGPFMSSLEQAFDIIKKDVGPAIFGKNNLRDVIDGKLKSHPELIELISSSGVRGFNLLRNYILLNDEFQNYAPKVGLEFLPRLGAGKILFSGDPFQTDDKNIDMGYNAMRELMVRMRNRLDYDDEDRFNDDLDLQNNTAIFHFKNTLRSKHTQAILYRYQNILN